MVVAYELILLFFTVTLGDILSWKTVVFEINSMSEVRKFSRGKSRVKRLTGQVLFIQIPNFSMPS